ncbi:hypothetical protein [Dactylosporangium sp. NPDC051484]|uniref:hypothetical protein n=1 Tax=Dactylosporangium sp. NPDC051484 TaxID=3154942 RepID=UPI00345014E5
MIAIVVAVAAGVAQIVAIAPAGAHTALHSGTPAAGSPTVVAAALRFEATGVVASLLPVVLMVVAIGVAAALAFWPRRGRGEHGPAEPPPTGTGERADALDNRA